LREIENYLYATFATRADHFAQRCRSVQLDEILSERDRVNEKLQLILDQDTEAWGIKVTKVEVKQVDIPEQMQRAIARQAEASGNAARR